MVIEDDAGPGADDQAAVTGEGPAEHADGRHLTVLRTRPAVVGGATATEAQLEDGRALILFSWADPSPS